MEQNDFQVFKVGDKIADFEFDAYLPAKKDFVKMRFQDIFKEKKWLILFFYPADFTFVCPTELADMGSKNDEFSDQGAVIVSMSTDTHFTHFAWHEKEQLLSSIRFPMGADPAHKISKAFGVYDELTGLSLRGTFIVDPDRLIVSSEVLFYNVGRSSEELMRKYKALRHVRENPAAVCPARWVPGQKTLTPGSKIIGKVGEQLDLKEGKK